MQKPTPAANPQAHGPHRTYSAAPPAPLRDGERFLELSMERDFIPAPPKGTDVYRCFLIDPGLDSRTFITGSQFLPQNADIVHHAIFFRVQPEQLAQAKELDEKDEGDGWSCFGGTGIGNSSGIRQTSSGAAWIAAWAPGGDEVVLGSDLGYEMPAGSQVVMQMHYNLLSVTGTSDRSGIRLRLTDKPTMRPLQTMLLPGPVELPCTEAELAGTNRLCARDMALLDVRERFGSQSGFTIAGLNLLCSAGQIKTGPTQTCDHYVKESGSILASAGHMHLLGRSIKVELNPGTQKAKVLLDVTTYDFDNQGSRPLAEPVKVKAGDKLRVTCTHDASLRSQLPALKEVEPRYVVWGEGTSDEMCLGIVTWTR